MNLIDLTRLWEQFKTSAIENAYNEWAKPNDLNPIANELIEAIKQYVEEGEVNGPDSKQTNT